MQLSHDFIIDTFCDTRIDLKKLWPWKIALQISIALFPSFIFLEFKKKVSGFFFYNKMN